jgi:hypothetical protein
MGRARPRARGRRALALAVAVTALLALAGSARAHGAALRGSTGSLAIPTWLFLGTGGLVVGASFLLATVATDRAFVRHTHTRTHAVGEFGGLLRAARRWLAPAVGLLGLAAVLVFGFGAQFDFAPADPKQNLAVLLVWVAWWAGYVITLYLVGNSWPAIDPFRTIASVLPSLDRSYPDRVGAWPAVAGLLALVFAEVTLPLAEDPVLLATAVATYGAVTIAGAVAFGVDEWFTRADPVSRAFDHYGRVAPVTRDSDGDGITLRSPGAGLVERGRSSADRGRSSADRGRPSADRGRVAGSDGPGSSPFTDRGGVAFVVALVFATTYDGFVATPGWRWLAETVHAVLGLPGLAIYAGAFALGFAVFLACYRAAAVLGRHTGDTYVTVDAIARRFAPPLLAIAAGYHLAHYLGFFVSLSLPLGAALLAPTNPPAPSVFVVPDAMGAVGIASILLGHLLAIWASHAVGFETFPDRLQAVRAQYALVAVMVAYTMLSLWIVAEPTVTPPLL